MNVSNRNCVCVNLRQSETVFRCRSYVYISTQWDVTAKTLYFCLNWITITCILAWIDQWISTVLYLVIWFFFFFYFWSVSQIGFWMTDLMKLLIFQFFFSHIHVFFFYKIFIIPIEKGWKWPQISSNSALLHLQYSLLRKF